MDNRQFFCVFIAAEDAALLKEQAEKFGVDAEQYAGQLLSMAVRRDFSSSSLPLLTHLQNIEAKVTELLNRPIPAAEMNTAPVVLAGTPESQDEVDKPDEHELANETVGFDYDDSEPEEEDEEEDVPEEAHHQSQSLLFEAINQRIPETDDFEPWLNEKIGGLIFDMWLPQIRTKLVMTDRLQPDTPSERERWQEAGLEKAGILEFVNSTPEDIERVAEIIATRWKKYKHPEPAAEEKAVVVAPAPQEEPKKIVSRAVGTLAQDVLSRVAAKATEEGDPCYDALFIGITRPAVKGGGLWDIAHGKMFVIEDLDEATGRTFLDTQLRRAVSKLVQWGHVRRVERSGQLAAYRVAKPLIREESPSTSEGQTRTGFLERQNTPVTPAVTHKSAAPELTSSPAQRASDNPWYEIIAAELISQSREFVSPPKTFTVDKIIELARIPHSGESEATKAILALHAEGFLKATDRMGEKRYNFEMPPRADLDQYRRATQNAIKLNGDKLPGTPKGEAFTAYDVRRALGAAERHHAAICFALASLSQMGLLLRRSKRTITNTYTIA